MSTRSEIHIKFYNTKVRLYHHCDGYFDGVGKDLVDLMLSENGNKFSNPDIFVKKMLEDNYELTLYNHVDIEYLYEIDFLKKTIYGYRARYTEGRNGLYRINKSGKTDMIRTFGPKGIKDEEKKLLYDER